MGRLETIHPSSDAFVWQERKVALGQYFLLSAFLAGKNTHTRNLVALFITWALSFLSNLNAPQLKDRKTTAKHTHFPTLLCF